MITQERLKELLHYDPDTGVFTQRLRTSRRVKVGDVAGNVQMNGYIRIMVDGRRYMAHRLAWLYINGVFPEDQIDHRDGNTSNNRISNLREATNAQNHQNRSVQRNNPSGLTGVSLRKSTGKWVSQIQINGRRYFLGYYTTEDDAYAAYCAAKAEHHQFQPVPRLSESNLLNIA